jgi:DNA phosphorothioation-associated putative methyltransferase
VSYLEYPEFDADEHPALAQSVVVDLQGRSVKVSSYRQRENPPILHRKELFVSTSYPLREKFDVLTREEVAAGLYADTSTIGTRNGWEEVIAKNDVSIEGHRVLDKRS